MKSEPTEPETHAAVPSSTAFTEAVALNVALYEQVAVIVSPLLICCSKVNRVIPVLAMAVVISPRYESKHCAVAEAESGEFVPHR